VNIYPIFNYNLMGNPKVKTELLKSLIEHDSHTYDLQNINIKYQNITIYCYITCTHMCKHIRL